MTQLTCPACHVASDVKRLTFSMAAAVLGVAPQEAQCERCKANNPVTAWIGGTANCSLAPHTYFFSGRGKKKKLFHGGMALAGQAGPGTGLGVPNRHWSRLDRQDPALNLHTADVSIHIVDDDVTLIGEFSPSAGGGGRYVVILSGSGQDAATYRIDKLFSGFNLMGHNALAVDYRGYGGSTGNTTKQGIYADTRAMVAYLRDVRGAALNNIVIHGWSIGSAPAVETVVAMENAGQSVRCVIPQCPISSTYGAARAHGSNVAMAAIGSKMFAMNNIRKIAQMRTPCLILKGQHDKPGFRDMADRLQEDSYSATLIDFNAGHADHDAIFQLLSGAAIRLFLS
jgi:pimeloyl-ACP methyl ester carboxylesterase